MVNVKRLMLVDVNCAKITADIDMMWHLPPSSGTRGVFFSAWKIEDILRTDAIVWIFILFDAICEKS